MATLKGALLLAPEKSAPLVLVTTGDYTGPWRLEDLFIELSSCGQLDIFTGFACDLQPALWITSSGWSLTIHSFTPPLPHFGTFSLSNVTLTCNTSSLPSPAASTPAACVTTTASTPAELLGLLSNDAVQYGKPLPPPSSRLHVTLTSNLSLDVAAWRAAHPVMTRPVTTVSGTCMPGSVTALNLAGGTSLMGVKGGAVIRFLCLELVNLATDTMNNMPRGLLSGAVWAVDVNTQEGSQLWVDNCTLILTKDEFLWQSYYMAQALANTAIGSSVTSVLRVFQGSITTSNLQWHYVSSPHTRWRGCILTTAPSVFPMTVPNSFVMRYLGHSMYLTDLRMVYSCAALLGALRNASQAAVLISGRPYAIVLGANISIGGCWPAEGLTVSYQSVALMGLPDRTTTLDLSGRSDVITLAPGASLSLRYLTLLGLGAHSTDFDHDDAGDQPSPSPAASSDPTPATSSSTPWVEAEAEAEALSGVSMAAVASGEDSHFGLVTSMLWAFHFSRLGLQLHLDNVNLVVPYIELKQCDILSSTASAASKSDLLPYFSSLNSYLTASLLNKPAYTSLPAQDPFKPPAYGSASFKNNSTGNSTDVVQPITAPVLPFLVLLLPGVRGLEVNLTSWPGQYDTWTASVYNSVNDGGGGGGGDPTGSGGGAPSGGSGWAPWKVGVLAAGVALAVVAVMAATLLYGRRRLGHADARSARHGGSSSGTKRSRDVEAGAGGGGGAATGGGGGANALTAAMGGGDSSGGQRRPLYDSFDDPAFELDLVKRNKLTPEDISDILERVNAEAAEFNMQMTEICGSGSFGVVYGGFWHGLKVAIKTMVFTESAPPLMAGQVARQQCIREAAFCCTMHHPNVVATHHYYLKSAKRSNMFDDVLQQMSSSCAKSETHRGSREASKPAAADAPARMLPSSRALSSGMEAVVAATAATAAVAINAADAEGAAIPMDATSPLPTSQGSSGDGSVGEGGAVVAAAAGEAAAQGNGNGSGGDDVSSNRALKEALYKGPSRRFRLLPVRPARLMPVRMAVTDWRLYLVQEYCDGGTLRQAVDEKKVFAHDGPKRGEAMAAATAAAAAEFAAAAGRVSATLRRPAARSDTAEPVSAAAAAAAVTAADPKDGGEQAHEGHSDTLSMCLIPELEALIAEANESVAAAGMEPTATAAAAGPGAITPLPLDVPGGITTDTNALPAASAASAMLSPSTLAATLVAGVQRLRAIATADSNIFGTTATNMTAESTVLGTTTSGCCCNEPNDEVPGPEVTMAIPMQQVAASPPLPAAAAVAAAAAGVPANVLPPDLSVVVHTALGIASGVAYLHSRSIIHGDLSANNVLLVKTSTPGVPVVAKLSDFGLSMRLEKGQVQLKNVHHGTPYYQSPEVMEQGTCSLAADVYSLGVLLWELYHGPPPWRAKKHKVHKPKGDSFMARLLQDVPDDDVEAVALAANEQKLRQPRLSHAAAAAAALEAELWDDPHYRLRACDVLRIAPHCPPRYARLLRRCLDPDPLARPSARAVVKTLLSMERGMAAAAAATPGTVSAPAGAPVGALMALTRPHLYLVPGQTHDAALLLEDFDAAAAAVAAAVERVTAEPTVAGAPASAGAAAAAAKAAQAGGGNVSGGSGGAGAGAVAGAVNGLFAVNGPVGASRAPTPTATATSNLAKPSEMCAAPAGCTTHPCSASMVGDGEPRTTVGGGMRRMQSSVRPSRLGAGTFSSATLDSASGSASPAVSATMATKLPATSSAASTAAVPMKSVTTDGASPSASTTAARASWASRTGVKAPPIDVMTLE